MIYSKVDDFTNSLFRDLNGKFDFKILTAMLIGILIGIVITSSIYGILVLLSLRKTHNKVIEVKAIDQELLNTLEVIKKDYVNITSGFTPTEKLKVLGNTVLNTVKTVALKYYPESKYPLYELNINELVILAHYITNRVDEMFDKRILRPFKNMSISQILKLLDMHKKVKDNRAVQVVKKVNPIAKTISTILNYANPVHWIKKLVVSGTINTAVTKMALIVIDIAGDETIKVYSKRLFDEEKSLLEEEINKELKEMEELK